MDVNAKQVGQLCRDWRAIVDVLDVRSGVPIKEFGIMRISDFRIRRSQWVRSKTPGLQLPKTVG